MYKIELFERNRKRLLQLEAEVRQCLSLIDEKKWLRIERRDIDHFFRDEDRHEIKPGIYEIEPGMVKRFFISNDENYVGNIFMDYYGLCENLIYEKFIERRKIELNLESKLKEEFGEVPKDPLKAIQQKIDEIHKTTAFDLLRNLDV